MACEVFCFKNPNRLWLARAIGGLIGECICYYILELKYNLNETLEFDKRKMSVFSTKNESLGQTASVCSGLCRGEFIDNITPTDKQQVIFE